MTAPDATSALYVGRIHHARSRPKRHALSYRVFMLLMDLDEAADHSRRLRWFSLERFNLLAFHPRDHGDGSATPLRVQVEGHLDSAGLGIDGGPIRLLCLPRVLGYVFNPISVYFCHRRDGTLRAILYEVSSTFGERHSYLIPVEGDGPIRQSVDKRLHVSPFLDMDLRYDFRITPPGGTVRIAIDTLDAEGSVLTASFFGERRDLTDGSLLRAVATHPLLTLAVVAGIHWEALKLALKGVRLRGGRPAPERSVSLGVATVADQTMRRYST